MHEKQMLKFDNNLLVFYFWLVPLGVPTANQLPLSNPTLRIRNH